MWPRCVTLRGRVRLVVEVLQAGVLAGLGLTPLGARFIHGVAPDGSVWKAAAAWLVVVVALAAAHLPMAWWLRRARRVNPAVMRPAGRPAERLARAAVLVGLILVVVLMLACLFLDNPGEVLALVVVYLAAAQVLVRVRLRMTVLPPSSERLTAVLATLPGEPDPAGQPAVTIAEGWPRQAATAGVLPRKPPVIVVAPPVAAALTDRQLRAVLAHELGHVRHGDLRRLRVRLAVVIMCAIVAALVLDRIPALRGLAGLHAPMTVESVPFLLACGYLTFRILYAVHLVAARAMEREADREMVKLTGDADGCIEAMTAVFAI